VAGFVLSVGAADPTVASDQEAGGKPEATAVRAEGRNRAAMTRDAPQRAQDSREIARQARRSSSTLPADSTPNSVYDVAKGLSPATRSPLSEIETAWRRTDFKGRRLVVVPT